MNHKHTLRYGLLLALLWTVVVLSSGLWALYSSSQTSYDYARIEASARLGKDLLYRRWAAMHGGVYVPVSDTTPPNPYLDVPHRDVVTTDGQTLTLVNPAYMTRQVHELENHLQGHITSLDPIRPQNAPDAWEHEALARFESGEVTEISSIETMNGEVVMRYMQALPAEEGCLSCHAEYEVGDIRGGISVAVPMAPYWDANTISQRGIMAGHAALWLFGLGGIGLSMRGFLASARREDATNQRLRGSEERFRAFVAQSNDGIVLVDQDARVIEWNPGQEAITGISKAEALGQPLVTVQSWSSAAGELTQEEIGKIDAMIRRVLVGESAGWVGNPIETILRHRAGSVRTVQSVIFPIDVGGTRILGGILRDISERRQMEGRLRRYRNIVSSTDDGIALVSTDAVYEIINDAYLDRMQKQRDEIVGHPVADVMGAEVFEQVVKPYLDRCLNGETVRYAEWFDYPAGRRYMQVTYHPYLNEADDIDGVVANVRDITAEHEYQQREFDLALEQERRQLLTSFIQNAAHEFRTPLATISTSTHLMTRTDDRERRQARAERVEIEIGRITRLIDMLTMMARLESSSALDRIPVDLRELMHGLCRYVAECAINCNVPDNLPPVLGDSTYLAEALRQVLDNACRFTPPDSEVMVSGGVDADSVWIAVCDTGPGIAADDLPHIFETFWRQDSAHSTPGFGLGLPIARRIIEAHGGSITVDSAVSQGTTVRVRLPTG